MTDDKINLNEMLEFTPIEIDETTAQMIRDDARAREGLLYFLERQVSIPFKLVVPPSQWDAAVKQLHITLGKYKTDDRR